MTHAVLLGDSVFANAAYVGGGPEVIAQLRQRLPAGWQASLAAVDGAVIADIPRQLDRVPPDATHLVISVGGNDALRVSAVLSAASHSVADSLEQLWSVRDQFTQGYRAMLDAVDRRGLPFAVSTIYDPRYPDPSQRRIGTAASASSTTRSSARRRRGDGPFSICALSAMTTAISQTRSSRRRRAAGRLLARSSRC